mmetsp:Transcript_17716/g.57531  ORF Transcript_17716/g.57531 Transcript_17716/m.57531 type:complete len:203 (-) Transcript_17716:42-650(-)
MDGDEARPQEVRLRGVVEPEEALRHTRQEAVNVRRIQHVQIEDVGRDVAPPGPQVHAEGRRHTVREVPPDPHRCTLGYGRVIRWNGRAIEWHPCLGRTGLVWAVKAHALHIASLFGAQHKEAGASAIEDEAVWVVPALAAVDGDLTLACHSPALQPPPGEVSPGEAVALERELAIFPASVVAPGELIALHVGVHIPEGEGLR